MPMGPFIGVNGSNPPPLGMGQVGNQFGIPPLGNATLNMRPSSSGAGGGALSSAGQMVMMTNKHNFVKNDADPLHNSSQKPKMPAYSANPMRNSQNLGPASQGMAPYPPQNEMPGSGLTPGHLNSVVSPENQGYHFAAKTQPRHPGLINGGQNGPGMPNFSNMQPSTLGSHVSSFQDAQQRAQMGFIPVNG